MTSTEKKIEELYGLIENATAAMLTTRRADGNLVSRPMATQERNPMADLWFVTSIETHKIDAIVRNPEVNVSYFDPSNMEWVSVSGRARITQDPTLIHQLYQPAWKMWFSDEGGERDGGPDDPRLALLLVEATSVDYLKAEYGKVRTLFELAKGRLTGTQPNIARQEHLAGSQI